MNTANELIHYGVKGMKWGVRKKYENKGGSRTKKGVDKFNKRLSEYEDAKRKVSEAKRSGNKFETKKAKANAKGMKWGVRKGRSTSPNPRKPKKIRAQDLNDDELRKRINRLSMERQYRDLTTKKSKFSKYGEKFVDAVLVGSVFTLTSTVIQQNGKGFLRKQGLLPKEKVKVKNIK